MTTQKCSLGVAAALGLACTANASFMITQLGTSAPPTTFTTPGGQVFPLLAAVDDTSPVFGDVTSAPLAAGLHVLFSIPMSHRQIGSGWSTWSHFYDGDVYYSSGASDVTLTFDFLNTAAFYFYVEPNFFGLHPVRITATSHDGQVQSTRALVEGSAGAKGFLVTTNPQTFVHSIQISLLDGSDFAVGEFGYSGWSPSPGALALLGVAGLACRRRCD